MRIARFLWLIYLGLLFAVGVQSLFVFHLPDPEDLPWTPLDLRAPVGLSTGRKLAALEDQPALCRALLREADVRFTVLPPRRQGAMCGWDNAVRLSTAKDAARPQVPLSCPLAAGFDVWMRRVVQPAATELLGSRVASVDTFGSYSCRRIYGRTEADWSQHAFANAVDVAGFRLANGRRITVARDWKDKAGGAFLHRVRDGACDLFSTTLSPDYNAAYRDHLHLDEAPRGAIGWRMCG